jgi:hypothetical protein
LVVQVEFGDGYDTILNARFFMGRHPQFYATRAPLMGLLVVLSESCRTGLGMHPMDMRPHHLLTAGLHLIYLFGVYFCMTRVFPRSWPRFLALAATLPCFLFFTLATNISHDIFPGVLLIWMVYLADQFLDRPRMTPWVLMVLMGAAAALIKHPLAMIWIGIVICGPILMLLARRRKEPVLVKRWAGLVGASAASAAITWLVLAWALSGWFTDTPMLARPWAQIKWLPSQYTETVFPLWIYLRNFHAIGLLAAMVWLLCFAFIHYLPMREVRYMAFLAPLTAVLIMPVLVFIWSRKPLRIAALVMLVVDAALFSIPEATRIAHPFYTTNQVRRFLRPLERNLLNADPASMLIDNQYLTFLPPLDSPLAGDRYHRMYHLGWHHMVYYMYGLPPDKVPYVQGNPWATGNWPDGTILIRSNHFLVNPPVFAGSPPVHKHDFVQTIAKLESILLSNADGVLQTQDGQPVNAGIVNRDGRLGLEIYWPDLSTGPSGQMQFPLVMTHDAKRTFKNVSLTQGGRAIRIEGLDSLNVIIPGKPLLLRAFLVDH